MWENAQTTAQLPSSHIGNPLQYSCLENSLDREAWWDYSPWGHKESDTTKWLINTILHSTWLMILGLNGEKAERAGFPFTERTDSSVCSPWSQHVREHPCLTRDAGEKPHSVWLTPHLPVPREGWLPRAESECNTWEPSAEARARRGSPESQP